jgi:hypothetical protein
LAYNKNVAFGKNKSKNAFGRDLWENILAQMVCVGLLARSYLVLMHIK